LIYEGPQVLVVVISHGARAAAGMEERLTLGSLVIVRISTSVVAYFFLAVLSFSHFII
jgi:hypothetical protein